MQQVVLLIFAAKYRATTTFNHFTLDEALTCLQICFLIALGLMAAFSEIAVYYLHAY